MTMTYSLRSIATVTALACFILVLPNKAEAACSVTDKVALAKAGYSKANIEKECGLKPDAPGQSDTAGDTVTNNPDTQEAAPAILPPPPELLAKQLRNDPTDKAKLKALVKEVQTKLNKFGFGAGTPDGVPGQRTQQAQEQLKKAFNVDLDGLPYTQQNTILENILSSEAGKKYVSSVQKLARIAKSAELHPDTNASRVERPNGGDAASLSLAGISFEAYEDEWLQAAKLDLAKYNDFLKTRGLKKISFSEATSYGRIRENIKTMKIDQLTNIYRSVECGRCNYQMVFFCNKQRDPNNPIQGARIRTLIYGEKVLSDAFKKYSAVSLHLPGAEVYPALEREVIDCLGYVVKK